MQITIVRPVLAALCGALVVSASPVTAQQQPASQPPQPGRAMTFADFAAVRNVGDPQLSPDGRRVLYTVRTTDVDRNRRTTRTFLADVDGSTAPRELTHAGNPVAEARWSPSGNAVAFISGGQLWWMDLGSGQAQQLTRLNGGATGPVWSPTGTAIAFTSAVYPECTTDACNASRDSARTASQVKAIVADELLFRHWNAWDDGTRSHLFVVALDGSAPRDLTPGARYHVPPPPFGGAEAYAWSPDGLEIAYSAKDQGRANAWSTDVNVYVVPSAGGEARVITVGSGGADQNPVYTPDGKYIAYQSQRRGGFESDRWRLMLYDRATGVYRELLANWDRSADTYAFTPEMDAVYVSAVDRGRDKLFMFRLASGQVTGRSTLIGEMNNTAFTFSTDRRRVAFLRDAAHRPHELHVATLGGATATDVRALTSENAALVAQLALNPVEEMWFRGAGGDSVHAFIIRPPGFRAGERYPVVLLVHGGPQGAWLDTWHGRWNYQMFAAPGFGLVIVNPRGSTGYGQRFVDEVSRDWNGRVVTDLMRGLDTALARNPWMDRTRVGAAGGSYGGYMVNWLAGNSTRFKALVSHAGPFNLEAMYSTTEELWFVEWDFGGPIWNTQAMQSVYRRQSPHLYARNMNTPTLVTGGQLDFRVPYTESIAMFTTLQRRGVPSRLLLFPDEGHWIGRPQNQRLWWGEVQGWLSRYLNARPNT